MPSVATSGPKAHPNAHLAGLPASLTPPPPVKATNTIWQPSELVPGSYRATGGDRKHRMSSALAFNLNHAIDLLKRSNCGIRDVIRQHESAWVALRLLYNHVVILQTLLERLRDMLENVAHVESVARDVNIYQPHLGDNDNTQKDMPKDRSRGKTEGKTEEKTKGAETGKQKTTKNAASFSFTVNRNPARTHKSPLAWSRRVLPRVEDMMPELRNYLVTIEEACVWTVRRQSSRFLPDPDAVPLRWNDNYIFATVHKLCSFEQNIEVHMTTCKYINMISTDALYKDGTGMRLDDSDTRYFLDDGSSRRDRAAFFTFWSSVSLAKAAKRHRGKDKKKKQPHHEKHTTKDKGKGKSKQRIEASKDGTESPAGKEDLVAAIDRKDYLTIVTLLMSDMSLNDMLEDGTFVLSHAVDDDNAALVSMLAICGADPNVRHRSGNTPLHFASNTDCVASALVLLEIGAKVDVRDAQGLTPLHIACRERHVSIVLHLLAHGADPNVCDDRGVTPLGYALMHPKRPTLPRELVTTLLTYGARATGRDLVLSPFVESIFRYDSTLMGRYLRKTPEVVDAEMAVATAGPDDGIVRLRPLYAALLVGNIFAIDLLLRRGADIHHVTAAFDKTTTYLDLAVQSDSTAIVSRLLLANADPNVAAANGRTPLHAAASAAHGELEVVALLLRHGADVHARTTDRHSQALHMAVRAGRADMCFHLMKSGAQVNAPLRSGVTPVMLAVYFNNQSMLRFLMSKGGDVRYKTPQYGETAMHTASRVGDIALAMLLLQHGLSVNAVHPFQSEAGTDDDGADRHQDSDDDSGDDSDVTDKGTAKIKDKGKDKDKAKTASPSKRSRSRSGYAPIHAAASRGHLDMVRWLLANGADPTARIGRIAARVCLGDDDEAKRQAERKEREGEGEVAPGRPLGHAKHDKVDGAADQGHKDRVDNTADHNTADHDATVSLDATSDDDDKEDPGATPVEIARAFGHERTAGVIEDAILAASPQYKEFVSKRRSSTSSLSSEDAPPDARSPPPKNKSSSQNSFEPEYDSADEGDALAGELGKGKKKAQVPATPPPETSAGDGDEHDDDDDVADPEPADWASAW